LKAPRPCALIAEWGAADGAIGFDGHSVPSFILHGSIWRPDEIRTSAEDSCSDLRAAGERHVERQTKIGVGADCGSIVPCARSASKLFTQPHERREMTGVRFERERV
jgi:hypothetical protein